MKFSPLFAICALLQLVRALSLPQTPPLLDDNNNINISAQLTQEEIEQLRFQYTEPSEEHHDVVRNSKRAITSTYRQYLVTLNGFNRGNPVGFAKSGYLFIFDNIPTRGSTNGYNPKDFLLTVGSPAGASFPGAIRYYSNSYLVRLLERGFGNPFDYAFVRQSGRTYTITPEARYAHLNSYSEFNPKGYLFDVYDIQWGSFVFTLSTDGTTLSGNINLIGAARQGNLFSPPNVPYRASVTGRYQATRRITF
ncbi:hypothetical protein H072_2407 [Dactylellina haptotyla CBS 200.50]|uniref:Uncharacterized protein n=1 Tax=Dactylellina haptotyla (strain CBS 200.50) TaxID=1284197 RepID=S8BVP6_DACHA|nr:hypothetical protein H072_2407 [Dactylellina haptotyla CBS 200.50]